MECKDLSGLGGGESKTGMRQGRVRMEKGIWIEREQIAVAVWSINIPLTCAVYIEKKY